MISYKVYYSIYNIASFKVRIMVTPCYLRIIKYVCLPAAAAIAAVAAAVPTPIL